jgi:predicted PurR-regulated permease PerM
VTDRIREFFREETPRRALAFGLFFAGLILFRKLFLLLIFFVTFERIMRHGQAFGHKKLRMPPRLSLLITGLLLASVVGGGLALGVGRGVKALRHARETLPAKIASIREGSLYQQAQEHLEDAADKVVAGAEHYAASAMHVLSAFGHGFLYAIIGFILALIFLLEKKEIDHFREAIDPKSLPGTLLRWYGHVGEACLVMVQFQLVVAACNAALTQPVLILIGLPHVASLCIMIFVSGLVPVVGNVVSGAILSLLAFQVKGWAGVAIFIVLTFILHKIESYYLNPRLASRHVALPGFVLVVSLLLFEHLFGFIGLFLSFPTLFVAQKIRTELRRESQEDETARLIGAEPPPLSQTVPPPSNPPPA